MSALGRSLSRVATQYEIILVNDGSRDRSWDVISELSSHSLAVRGLNLMRKYGQHNASLCSRASRTGRRRVGRRIADSAPAPDRCGCSRSHLPIRRRCSPPYIGAVFRRSSELLSHPHGNLIGEKGIALLMRQDLEPAVIPNPRALSAKTCCLIKPLRRHVAHLSNHHDLCRACK